MTKFLTIIALSLLLVGCSTTKITTNTDVGGIKNFKVVNVEKKIYKGGQPDTNGFIFLKSIGITNIVKLNTKCEASDKYAETIGIHVVYVPFNTWDQLVHTPSWKVNMAVTNIVWRTYVHCEHGQDRTGLIMAIYRILTGYTKDMAQEEMLNDGFHKSEFALWAYFKHYDAYKR